MFFAVFSPSLPGHLSPVWEVYRYLVIRPEIQTKVKRRLGVPNSDFQLLLWSSFLKRCLQDNRRLHGCQGLPILWDVQVQIFFWMPPNLFQWKHWISTHLVTEVSGFVTHFLIADANIFSVQYSWVNTEFVWSAGNFGSATSDVFVRRIPLVIAGLSFLQRSLGFVCKMPLGTL